MSYSYEQYKESAEYVKKCLNGFVPKVAIKLRSLKITTPKNVVRFTIRLRHLIRDFYVGR